MRSKSTVALIAMLLGMGLVEPVSAAEGHRADLVNRTALRVCADPANMPFSNERGEGFENKIAEIVAAEFKVPIEYTWFPQATGFIRQTLFAKRCDVVIGYAQGDELVLNTNHYYRSAYALVYRAGSGLDGVDSLSDPRLKGRRIGVTAGTPPGSVMARLGLIEHAKPYPLMVDRRYDSPGERMIEDIRSGVDRRRRLVGADRRIFRRQRRRQAFGCATPERGRRSAHGLSHYLWRAQSGRRLEASAQRRDRQATRRYRYRAAGIRRAVARRAIQSHHIRDDEPTTASVAHM